MCVCVCVCVCVCLHAQTTSHICIRVNFVYRQANKVTPHHTLAHVYVYTDADARART